MSNYSTIKIKRFAQMFGALSNPNRATIFLRLAACCCGEAISCGREDMRTCVGDLGKNLNIAPSTVSHHIKELNRAGLIQVERCGRTVKCCVDPGAVQALTQFFVDASSEVQSIPLRKRKRI
jgi:ArsR family transcriptional regulator